MNNDGEKYSRLLENLGQMEGAVVGFSGGVDSTFLLHAAIKALGSKVLAVTLVTPYVTRWEVREAQELTKLLGVRHRVVELDFPEEIRENPEQRCYICKKILFNRLKEIAAAESLNNVLDGTNVDDLADYRPGLKALQELEITSPLTDAGLTKQQIRSLSKTIGLNTWAKPSFACLLSRIPHNSRVTEEELRRIETAELVLMELGFAGVRVRSHGDLARIEVSEEEITLLVEKDRRESIRQKLQNLGYRYVTVDIGGYKMGSLNPQVQKNKLQESRVRK